MLQPSSRNIHASQRWTNVLQLINEQITCIEHDESTWSILSVIEEIQSGCDASENAFGLQVAIGFVFCPEHILLLTVKCKLDSHIQQYRAARVLHFECAMVGCAYCILSNFGCQDNCQAFTQCIGALES
jgi:hypothetical protein